MSIDEKKVKREEEEILHRHHWIELGCMMKYRFNHAQKCPLCEKELDVIENHVGGGSHYWHLCCLDCQQEYYYDTYRFVLERRSHE